MTPNEQLLKDVMLNVMPNISSPASIAALYIREATMGTHPEVDMMVMLRALYDMANKRHLSIADELHDMICVMHDDFVNSQILSDDELLFSNDEVFYDLG